MCSTTFALQFPTQLRVLSLHKRVSFISDKTMVCWGIRNFVSPTQAFLVCRGTTILKGLSEYVSYVFTLHFIHVNLILNFI